MDASAGAAPPTGRPPAAPGPGQPWADDDGGFGAGTWPLGVVDAGDGPAQTAVAVGSGVLRLGVAAQRGLLDGVAPAHVFAADSLNGLLALGRPVWSALRARVGDLLADPARRADVAACTVPAAAARPLLPVRVADYVDFSSSLHHARALGRLYPQALAVPASFRHLPLAYHGRAGSVVVSGTGVRRPCVQRRPPRLDTPVFGPSQRLDVEAELAFVVGVGTAMGSTVAPEEFADHVFGAVLLADWSARDALAWEQSPLGPFAGKSFATTVSAWVVPLEALAAARVPPGPQEPAPLPHLRDPDPWALDVALELEVAGTVVSRPPFASVYWTPGQQLAHLTSSGAPLRPGDLFGSGTVSGPGPGEAGSLLELSAGGADPFGTASGPRTFLHDGDAVVLRGTFPAAGGGRGSFGELAATVLPAAPAR